MRRKRNLTQIEPISSPPDPLVRLWMLRILVLLGTHRRLINRHCFSEDLVAAGVGLGHWIDCEDETFEPKAVLRELRKLHQRAEQESGSAKAPDCLADNVARLQRLIGLNATECRILEFVVQLHNDRHLNETAELLGSLSTLKLAQALATILGLSEREVKEAFSGTGILARSGLVEVDRRREYTMGDKLELLSNAFGDQMISDAIDPVELLRGKVAAAPPAQLGLEDYAHFAEELALLQPWLRHALETARPGANIYLHGPPGTGKTQLARALAAALSCELFEVACEDEDGDPINGEQRLRALRAAQTFLARRRALIVFDEAEDVFHGGDGLFGQASIAQRRKGWMNHMLEENTMPTIWLSNRVDGLDSAFVRRFDSVFELAVPPRQQRARILRELCGELLDEAGIARLAEVEYLAPAVVSRAGAVVSAIGATLDAPARAAALERLVSNTLRAQGHRPLSAGTARRLPACYDPDIVEADADLTQLAAGLKETPNARLCFYGPPGTGKTAYARWLAARLDRPLLVKPASALMSKWLGDSEKNIARAFRQAEREGAVLLFDEVDSFLQDRRGAGQHWEVSTVNELLTRMEAFDGIFIAATNLMGSLDQAALRRFDLKVKFGYLRPQPAWQLFERYCAQLALGSPDAGLAGVLARLQQLTPGDFAAVARQHRFRPLASPAALLEALQGECALKEGGKAVLGFV